MGPNGEAQDIFKGVGYLHQQSSTKINYDHLYNGHPGFGWAMTKLVYEQMGGIFDESILGAADSWTAYSFIQQVDTFLFLLRDMNISKEIFKAAYKYQLKAKAHKFILSYINGTVLHAWHGPLSERDYLTKYRIYKKHGYNPKLDISRDNDGLISLSKKGERMHDDLKEFYCFKCLKINSNNKRILFYSKHIGTVNEMKAIFEKRKMNYTINMKKALSIHEKFHVTILDWMASRIFREDFFISACNTFDLIIISDVLSLGRPFLQESPKNCKAKILLQVTTRFDFGHVNDIKYTNLFKSLVNNSNIYWQANNDFELVYLNYKKIFPKPKRFWLIKPIGHSFDASSQHIENIESPKVVIFNKYYEFVKEELMKVNK